MTCADLLPSGIEFSPNSYTAYSKFTTLSIHPTVQEFTDCQISPTLPAGMTLASATCTILGKPTAALAQTTFTVTSTRDTRTYQGTFTLQVIDCTGTLAQVFRSYKTNSQKESFSIKDVTTQQVVLSVAANSGQPTSQDWSTYLCLTSPKYEIDVGSTDEA